MHRAANVYRPHSLYVDILWFCMKFLYFKIQIVVRTSYLHRLLNDVDHTVRRPDYRKTSESVGSLVDQRLHDTRQNVTGKIVDRLRRVRWAVTVNFFRVCTLSYYYYLFVFIFADNLLNAIPIETHGKWFASVLEIHQRRTPTSQKWSINLYSFAVKYLAILVKTENRFLTLIEARVIQPIITQLDTISSIWEHSVFNAYMSLLRTLITHRSGILFVLEKGNCFWFM